jgi:hypothetical protein
MDELDHLFFKTLRQSTALIAAGAGMAFAIVVFLNHYIPSIGRRMVSEPVFLVLLMTTVCNHVVQSEALYLRSYKKEPFLFMSVSIAVVMALCSWYGARIFGALGVAASYFAFSGVAALMCGSAIFILSRRKWRQYEEKSA